MASGEILLIGLMLLFLLKNSLQLQVSKRVWMGGGPVVGRRLKFSNFVGSRLKFSIFVGSRLNFSIFVGCRKISVNKWKRLLIINIFYVFDPLLKTLIPKEINKLVRMHHLIAPKPFINSCLFMQHYFHCLPNEYSTDKITKAFIVNANVVSQSTTGHSRK